MLTSTKEATFSIDTRGDEYARLMDASVELANVNDMEEDDSEINVDRYLKATVDRQPSALEIGIPKKHEKLS